MSPYLPKPMRTWASNQAAKPSRYTPAQRQWRFRLAVAAVGLLWVGMMALVFFVIPSYGVATGVIHHGKPVTHSVTFYHADPRATIGLYGLVLVLWTVAVVDLDRRRRARDDRWSKITVAAAVLVGLWAIASLLTVGLAFFPLFVVLVLLAMPLDQLA